MNILSVFVLFAILLKCAAASGDALGVVFKEAVDEGNFGWLKENWERWWNRKDLLDYVIRKGADVIIWFIQNPDRAKERALAALFDKGRERIIDDVLSGIKCDDNDLAYLTYYRSGLGGSPEKFFRVLDKIKGPERQENAVHVGVESLFKAERHDSVPLLVNALGKRTFKSESLKEKAIQAAICWGARIGNQAIVELYHEHSAITSYKYAHGLFNSWHHDGPNQVFPFLLCQADQGDLDEARRTYAYRVYPKFRLAIDEAFKTATPVGSRIISVEKVQLVLDVLAPITSASDKYGPGIIIEEYLLGEKEKMKKGESEGQETGAKNPTD